MSALTLHCSTRRHKQAHCDDFSAPGHISCSVFLCFGSAKHPVTVGPIGYLEPTRPVHLERSTPNGVRTCENTGRGNFGSVIGQRVTHPNVLADYRSVKHPSLALVATSKLYDRWILISDPFYITANRTLARSYGLGETPSRKNNAGALMALLK